MLLPEDPLDLLLDRLRALPGPDRHAVLARLDAGEHRRLDAALRTRAEPGSAFTPDIAQRIAAPLDDTSMTPATRAVLARVAARTASVPDVQPAPSLLDRLGSALRRR